MKKIALAAVALSLVSAGAASAADMAVKALRPLSSLPTAGPVATWVLKVADLGRNRSISNGTNNGTANGTLGSLKSEGDFSGGIVGGTVGCNYQVNQWVFGIEGDYSCRRAGQFESCVLPSSRLSERTFLRTISRPSAVARLGLQACLDGLWHRRAAFADLRIHEFNPTAALGSAANIGAAETHQYAGWTAGVGIEWGFAPNWSAKFEYLYMDLGHQDFFATTVTSCCTFQNTRLTDNVVRAGINYRFNWAGPVVAKY